MGAGDYISFTVPGLTIGKGRPDTRVIGKGDEARALVHTNPRAAAYMLKVKAGAKVAMAGRPAWDGPVIVSLKVWLPIPTSAPRSRQQRILSGEEWFYGLYDVDNMAKSCLDGMNKIVFLDDRQVMRLLVDKEPRLGVPAVDIVVVRR